MDPTGIALLVALVGLLMFVLGVVLTLSAHYGSFDGVHVVRGWVLLLYGMWVLQVGGVLLRLTQTGTSILILGVILGTVGVIMLTMYPWVVAEIKKHIQTE